MENRKLVKLTIIGAITGAAISLLDRKTRQHTVECVKKASNTIHYYMDNRQQLQTLMEEKIATARSIYDNVAENVEMIMSAKDELKEVPHTVQELISETKTALTPQETDETI